jgi:hypothetical protein
MIEELRNSGINGLKKLGNRDFLISELGMRD